MHSNMELKDMFNGAGCILFNLVLCNHDDLYTVIKLSFLSG